MKRKIIIFSCLVLTAIAMSACQQQGKYTGEFNVNWGSEDIPEHSQRLEDNNIPYETRDGKIFIQEDAVKDATECCT
ncbi:hypothetical protein [Shouchella clausii]|uniref:hypothetical protein n=1 Tax=Shouchella TaxID=2893057 RepID=UPI000B95E92E|nr:hypothetical protein [Shouchella clausii]AST98407.1 hypothetical protein BC8716_21760 [Shouchella clausii]MCR1287762.1 hypothetical protein [Shouchella clausii]MEB5472914.1 hypothetical protein [Shouchella clausii]PAD13199.1 hypothetical protein CHH73_20815 [Shouchella clausii]QNM44847.1 hypothetical protein DUT88_19080 [Shouchella clausii]